MSKGKVIFNIQKEKKFSKWYSEILNKAEIVDLRYGVKGFVVIRPWGSLIMEKMYRIYESALRRTGHSSAIFPTVIPEENFEKEASHVKGFMPEVFWLESFGEEKLALRPTSETAFYQMYSLWIRSWRDLPLKIYQRASVFRKETKATRPLIRSREFYWIESHDAFATKEEAEEQVKEDISMTEEVMHKIFGVPFLPMKRPDWDKFPGAEYTVGSDSILPDGKVIQQPSTHMLGQGFSKAFNIKFIDKKGRKNFVYITCYGPAISRILASVISVHGDDKGLILPTTIAPAVAVIVPVYERRNKEKIRSFSRDVYLNLCRSGLSVEFDDEEKRPGEKFYFWEMKGVPFRIEIGENEIEQGRAKLVFRDNGEKVYAKFSDLAEEIKNLGAEFDVRLKTKADDEFYKRVIDCRTKDDVKKALRSKKVARFNFCSLRKEGEKCAEFIEKELSARVMGKRADKEEEPMGNCIFCGRKAGVVAYAGKSY